MSDALNHVNFVWTIAESLRGPFKPSEYGSVVLPFTVLRRLDAVPAETKHAVLDAAPAAEGQPAFFKDAQLRKAAGRSFYNTSPWDMNKLTGDADGLRRSPRSVRASCTKSTAAHSKRSSPD